MLLAARRLTAVAVYAFAGDHAFANRIWLTLTAPARLVRAAAALPPGTVLTGRVADPGAARAGVSVTGRSGPGGGAAPVRGPAPPATGCDEDELGGDLAVVLADEAALGDAVDNEPHVDGDPDPRPGGCDAIGDAPMEPGAAHDMRIAMPNTTGVRLDELDLPTGPGPAGRWTGPHRP